MSNQRLGKEFEEVFKKRAQSNGFLAEKNNLTARYLPNGRVKVLKSDLDYRLTSQNGRIGYFDCKSFIGDSFIYSDIDPDQLKRAINYEYWKVPSGFIIWFRKVNRISWFSGHLIMRKGPRTSFKPEDGILLGSLESFDLKPLLKQ